MSTTVEELLTKKELASKFKVSPRTINNWMNDGMPVEIQQPNYLRFSFEKCFVWKRKQG